jgi:hypothetical protein
MPELSYVSAAAAAAAARSMDSTDKWGGYLLPLEGLEIPKYFEKHMRITASRDTVYLTLFEPWMMTNDDRAVTTMKLPLLMAYQLRDFLNKNLDDLAWCCAEVGSLKEHACKALSKFKKVYYEDEIENPNKSEETSDNKTEETEVS